MRIIAFLVFLLLVSPALAQEYVLDLATTVSKMAERKYDFSDIIDARAEKAIGIVYSDRRDKLPVSFESSMTRDLLIFYRQFYTASPSSAHQIQVKVYNFDLKEIYQADSKLYRGNVQLSLGFFAEGNAKPVHLVDYNGSLEYRRSPGKLNNINEVVRNLFQKSWEFFDAWIQTQELNHRELAEEVILKVFDPIRPSSRDTVFYDPERPLTWEDFTDRPKPFSKNNATIFASFSIEGSGNMESGSIQQEVHVKAYMLPRQSWVKVKSGYALNHEQMHFDLVRVVADRMVRKLRQLNLEPYLFAAKLNDLYLDAYREMNKVQEAYDSQTRHGLDENMQAKWNLIIQEALTGNYLKLEAQAGIE
ncbi:hypothetical protein PBT90_10460 [Algoriphagus halophytocola]|uniref:DUF922 domain-containing protein n=1 Tax=Algoriphagus halophytocola TaxID=2991499 RepID=A0ABY6MJ38_9BACT|nr:MULTISPECIES: hypothetical protein [unclassified Algoriphagus]UZD23810.1 hypothetical protein OM944_04790 [Algoriphagus sp. TR-M5]WBL41177.1 hypothetical protein PBT90_10460 [Algoriphagus sp. TR-M9]